GKDIERPELQKMLAFVREGDVLIVHSLDRLAGTLLTY
ncbi:protein containing Resolvase, partial [gut metagenome]